MVAIHQALASPPIETPEPVVPKQATTGTIKASPTQVYEISSNKKAPLTAEPLSFAVSETISVGNENVPPRAQIVVNAGGNNSSAQEWSASIAVFLPNAAGRMEYQGSVRSFPDGKLQLADANAKALDSDYLKTFGLTDRKTNPDGTGQATLKLLSGDEFTLRHGPNQPLRIDADNNKKGVFDAGDLVAIADGNQGKSMVDVYGPSVVTPGNPNASYGHINGGLNKVAKSPADAILTALRNDRNSAVAGQLYQQTLASPPGGFDAAQMKNRLDWELLRSEDFHGGGIVPILKAMGFKEPEELHAAMKSNLVFKEDEDDRQDNPQAPAGAPLPKKNADESSYAYADLEAAMDLYRYGVSQPESNEAVPAGFVGWMNRVTEADEAEKIFRSAENVYDKQDAVLKEKDRDNGLEWVFEGKPDNPGEFLDWLKEETLPTIP